MRFVNRKDLEPARPGLGTRPAAPVRHLRLATSRRSAGKSSLLLLAAGLDARSSPATRWSASSSTTSTTSPPGTRVVLEPVLACLARGLDPCPNCAAGLTGPLRPRDHRPRRAPACRPATAPTPAAAGAGCSSRTARSCTRCPTSSPTAGPCWSSRSRARPHGAPRERASRTRTSLVIGAGTVGILTLLALKELTEAGSRHRRGQARAAAGVGGRVRRDRDRRAEGGDERRPPRDPAR